MDLSHPIGLTKISASGLPNAPNRRSSCTESATGCDATSVDTPAMSSRRPNQLNPLSTMLHFDQRCALRMQCTVFSSFILLT